VVAEEGNVVPDPRRRHTGRGAWLHPTPACLDSAEKRRAFPRALRVQGPLGAEAVRAVIGRMSAQPTEGQGSSLVSPGHRKQVDPS
jgi:uncharacterized protein